MPPEEFDALDSMSRDELVAHARALGAKRPEVMTRVELRDEIIRLSEPDTAAQRRSRGWLGVARDLVASVVESGLNMRDAAAAIRGDQRSDLEWLGPPPVATVTLAEIYVAQGHPERALGILDEVLAREPDHPAAFALRERLANERPAKAERKRARVPEVGVEVRMPVEAEPDASDEAPVAVRQPFLSEAPVTEHSAIEAVPSLEASEEAAPPEFTPISAEAAVDALRDPRRGTPLEEREASATGPESREPFSAEPLPESVSFAFEEEVPSAPISDYEPVPSSESPFSTMNPERTILDYAVDEPAERRECVLVREGGRLHVYWDIYPTPGPFLLRIAAFVPKSPEPERFEREIRLDEVEGGRPVDGVPPHAIVRAALGRIEGDAFVPLVVAAVIEGQVGGAKRSVYRPPGQSAGALEQELSTPTI
jgi:hypothetical protein